jgi:hypothetical protein
MPRGGARPGTGGARPGAGRPRKAVAAGPVALLVKAPKPKAKASAPVAVAPGQMTPLEYMLSVVNDVGADEARRDRMAQAAAPYVHPKAEAETQGKKAQRQAAAQTAEHGTDWESLLGPRN